MSLPLLVLALTGCGPSASQFPEKYVEAYCAHIVLCGDINTFESFEACVVDRTEVQATQNDGCEYDRKQARQCLDDVEVSTCDTLLDLPSCAAAFQGADCTREVDTEDTGPDLVRETFTQVQISPIDILWVIDGQSPIADVLDEAIEPMWEDLLLADPNWQMGVLDPAETGRNFALLETSWRTWPPPNNAFTVGSGGGPGRFQEVVYGAFELRSETQQNKDFLRAGAALYTVFVTEREDESNPDTVTPRAFEDWYLGSASSPRISVITDSGGRRYWEDLVLGGGQVFVSTPDRAASTVKDVLLDATGLEIVFTLEGDPQGPPDLVEVIHRNHADIYEIDRDYVWTPSDRTIEFKRVIPPPNSVVRVTYVATTPETTTPTE